MKAGCKFTPEQRMAAQTEYYDEEDTPVRAAAEDVLPHSEASIVPADSIAGRALLAVIAIMTFLAALTLGEIGPAADVRPFPPSLCRNSPCRNRFES